MRAGRSVLVPLLVACCCACGGAQVSVTGGDGGAARDAKGDGGTGNGSGAADGGTGKGSGAADGGAAAGPDGGCGAARATGALARQPVDVVLVIDNSGSMGDEIQAVEDSLNASFAEVLADAGVDWRLVLLSKHGPAVPDESICIEAPLSANATCSPPPRSPPTPRASSTTAWRLAAATPGRSC